MANGPKREDIDTASRKLLLGNIDALATELKLTPQEKKMLQDTHNNITKMRANPRLSEICKAFGFACGGVTC